MELKTKADYVKAHRELWDWLSKNPGSYKDDWPGWDCNDGKYEENQWDCFACDWAEKTSKYLAYFCENCLLVWPEGGCGGEDWVEGKPGLFNSWAMATEEHFSEASEFITEVAELIRDLPVRNE